MKLFILFLVVAASAAQARQFKCSEKATDALAKNRQQYSVLLTTLASQGPKGDYDRIETVRVSVLSRSPRTGGGAFRLDRPSFEATAKTADVMYNISAPKHGFSLGIYLDEMNESWMKLSNVRGDIRLNCH